MDPHQKLITHVVGDFGMFMLRISLRIFHLISNSDLGYSVCTAFWCLMMDFNFTVNKNNVIEQLDLEVALMKMAKRPLMQ